MASSPEPSAGTHVKLRHALHASGHFLPAGIGGEVVSLHRLHLRVRVPTKDGPLVVRLPREALEALA